MSQTRSVEWLLASMMLAWGFGLLLPGDTMSLPQHRMLGAIAPEFVWAAWSVSIGAVRVVALYINGSWRRTPLFRVAGASLGLIWWIVLGFLFWTAVAGGPWPAELMWFPVFIAFEGYSIFRGARDSYHTGALQRWQPHRP
ncbi:hypothetical protein OZ411_01395 [Bradyrhizobium sp. Arg237L]|uniref:hypothetical protein n=1 Tax=Bradyrhizobium sp. Arg237L TaxID=3003352 RepID=UPI00249F3F44|nr:hypothetical protein [Bradyrhizobium sp. Arg237L]MDI4231468.1 hypothetical protein [Bradyrhizobium sp. Arg237L]